MHLAYVDDSGNSGYGASKTFTLGCVMVDAARWPDVFDDVIDYRRFLKNRFGLPVRAEIKANHLVTNGGAFRKLGTNAAVRFAIYRGHLRLCQKLELKVFSVVIRKDIIVSKGLAAKYPDPRTVAWEYLLQRLERFTTKTSDTVMIVHDEGDGGLARKLTRKARRAGSAGSQFATGSLSRPAKRIVEDPVPRDSRQSYFLQLADLAAYAAFRSLYPPPPHPVQICPVSMWNELGAARYAPVSASTVHPPGVVVYPS
jgi:hypothetical protein